MERSRTALVTGASRGLGLALTGALVHRGWQVIVDARDEQPLQMAVKALDDEPGAIVAIGGDVADRSHRNQLREAVEVAGGLDLLVNNASTLGLSPQPPLADLPLEVLEQVYRVNTVAPLALIQQLLPYLQKRAGRVINLSSDAAVEAYEGWGAYGSSKAALDQLSAVLAAENPGLRIYAFDPGDMATDLQQQAFPDEDVSDRATPESVIPSLLRLVNDELESGRYLASHLSEGI